jgi:hypothetical protein
MKNSGVGGDWRVRGRPEIERETKKKKLKNNI